MVYAAEVSVRVLLVLQRRLVFGDTYEHARSKQGAMNTDGVKRMLSSMPVKPAWAYPYIYRNASLIEDRYGIEAYWNACQMAHFAEKLLRWTP